MTRDEKLAFIAKIAPAAQASQEKYGVPACITIAQAILESTPVNGPWGGSVLATEDNNYFGIKARAGEDYCEHLTSEYVQENGALIKKPFRCKFRKFRSVQESFDRHATLLSAADRYQPAMAVAYDPLAFAAQLYKCGYSTEPKYPTLLAGLIKQWNLTQFDVKTKGAKA